MKKSLFIIIVLSLLSACGAVRPAASLFVLNSPKLGIDKETFIAQYGAPYRLSTFYDDNGVLCEELIYREIIEHGQTTHLRGEIRAINSFFLFRNGELVSQHQEDDIEYQIKLDRERERQLIQEKIKADKERADAERERTEVEKERIKIEKDKAEKEKE